VIAVRFIEREPRRGREFEVSGDVEGKSVYGLIIHSMRVLVKVIGMITEGFHWLFH
jgi:hypothetical protein